MNSKGHGEFVWHLLAWLVSQLSHSYLGASADGIIIDPQCQACLKLNALFQLIINFWHCFQLTLLLSGFICTITMVRCTWQAVWSTRVDKFKMAVFPMLQSGNSSKDMYDTRRSCRFLAYRGSLRSRPGASKIRLIGTATKFFPARLHTIIVL